MKSLYFFLFTLFLTSCASPRLWLVKSDLNGGVVGYTGYEGLPYEMFEKDLNELVQCPHAVKLQEWENKSETTQGSIIVPFQSNSQTTINSNYNINDQYNQNLLKISGNQTSNTTSTNYQAIPYTNTNSWIEQRYVCDWNKLKNQKYKKMSLKEKINFHQAECSKNDMYSCLVLNDYYHKEKDYDKASIYAEKVCTSEDPLDSPIGCNYLALKHSKEGDFESRKYYLKKGCEIVKQNISKTSEDGKKVCTILGAITKNENDFSIGLPYMLDQCAKNYTNCYDLACAYSLKQDLKKSIEYLKLTLSGGFTDFEYLENDSDLNNLRKTKEYSELINEFKKPNELKLNKELSKELSEVDNLIMSDGCDPSPYHQGCTAKISAAQKAKISAIAASKKNDKDEIKRKKQEKELAKKLRDAFDKNP